MSLYIPNLVLPPDDRQALVLCIRHDGTILDRWGNQINTKAIETPILWMKDSWMDLRDATEYGRITAAHLAAHRPTCTITLYPDPETGLIRGRYIPCIRISDNMVGVWDTCKGEFIRIEGATSSVDKEKEQST